MENLLERARQLQNELVRHRRYLHMHPELGMELPVASAYVADQLTLMGYTPSFIGGCGVVATVGKPGGKTILLRADMDALPLQEESGLAFSSQVAGAAHCCGHDLHTAMLLGAARLLKEYESELPGMVKLMFQPGEETLEGARAMLSEGILSNPNVDAAMAVHVNSIVPLGRFLVFHGPVAASNDIFTIRVNGKGGHGSRPEETIDPINAACHIHTALQALQARELRSGEMGVLTIGSIHGGSAPNVIPESVAMEGTIRTYSCDIREMMIQRLQQISEQIGQAFRCDPIVEMSDRYTIPLVTDEAVASQVHQSLRKLFPAQQTLYVNRSFAGSEDFAFVTQQVPSSFVVLGAAISEQVRYGQHHPKVQFHEDCLPLGAAAYAQAALGWLNSNID